MRPMRTAILPIAIFFACLIWVGISYASVVTVDVAAKTAASDTTTLDVSKGLKFVGDQVGVFAKSAILEPQIFTLKLVGLKDGDYDIYVNHAFKGTRPGKDFTAGVQYRVDGRVTDPAMMRCLNAVKDRAEKASALLKASSAEEAQRVCYTLNQARDWTSSGIMRDVAFRSISIIIAPSGKRLQPMSWMTREGDVETASAVTRGCWLLQQARDRMYHVITDPALRNDAVVALTPVEFTAEYAIKNGKPHATAKLLNNCDLPISGDISMALPQGWKTTAKTLKFVGLKSGKTFTVSVDLVAPSKKAIAPDSVPMAANMTVVQDEMTASMKLKITATK